MRDELGNEVRVDPGMEFELSMDEKKVNLDEVI